MSEPSKAAPAASKKSPSAGVWKLAGITVSVLLGLIVVFWLASALLPGVFSGINGTLDAINNGLTSAGQKLGMMSMAIGTFMTGGTLVVFKILCYVLVLGIGFFGVREAFKRMKSDGGGHH